MKRWLYVLLVLPIFLNGCGKQAYYETVSDTYLQPAATVELEPTVQLPEGAAVAVIEGEESGRIYFCDAYTLTMQTLDAGDLERTVMAITGYDQDQIDLIETETELYSRYDCVWVSAGEGEEQLCRGAILDDGQNHYVLTCMADASAEPELREQWQSIFHSYCLTLPGEEPYTGS